MSESLGLIERPRQFGRGGPVKWEPENESPGFVTAQGFGCLFPFVKPYVGKRD